MPGSKKMARASQQRANIAAGLGDASGRLVRVKDEKMKIGCSICSLELVVTKTNTELKQHADAKHSKTLEECFPGAIEESARMVAELEKVKGGGKDSGKKAAGGLTKKEKKAKEEADFMAALAGGASGKKKKKKKPAAKKATGAKATAVAAATKKVDGAK
jgi:hypothetical protein